MPSLASPSSDRPPPAGRRPPRWRSLAERDGTVDPEAGVYPDGEQPAPEGFSRRSFLQILGASTALAGPLGLQAAAGADGLLRQAPGRRDPERGHPLRLGRLPRRLRRGGGGREPRGPPHQDGGQPGHPASLGGAGLHELATILDLYDPHRLAGVRPPRPAGGVERPACEELAALAGVLAKDGGARLRVLAEPTSSPTLADLRARLLARFPRARVDSWGPVADDAARQGTALAFGRPLDPEYRLAGADVILSLDADFLATEGDHLRQARDFASRRGQPTGMNRLYVAEASFTVTGGAADHRLRMRASEVLGFGRAVAAALAAHHGLAQLASLGAPLPGRSREPPGGGGGGRSGQGARPRRWCWPVDASRRRSTPWPRPSTRRSATPGPRWSTASRSLLDPASGPERLEALAGELRAGQVDTLVITAWNPVYTAPADLDLAALLRKVPNVIYLATARRRDGAGRRGGGGRGAPAGDAGATCAAATAPPPSSSRSSRRWSECVAELDLLAAFVGQGHLGAHRLVRDGWKRGPARPARASRVSDARFDRAWSEWLATGLVTGRAATPARAGAGRGALRPRGRGAPGGPAGARRPGGRLRPRRQGARRPLRRERVAAGAARTRSPS